MKVGQIGPTFIFPVKTVTFYWVKSLVTSSILQMRKSHKKLAPVYAYPHAYTQIRDRGGWLGPPHPTLNRVNYYRKFKRYPCFLQMVLFSLPALLVVFSLFTRSMSWVGTIGWKSPTTTWRPVDEAFWRAHGTLYQPLESARYVLSTGFWTAHDTLYQPGCTAVPHLLTGDPKFDHI